MHWLKMEVVLEHFTLDMVLLIDLFIYFSFHVLFYIEKVNMCIRYEFTLSILSTC